MSDEDRPSVVPRREDEVTEENEILVSARGIGMATLPEGTEVDISHNGSYIIFRFDDDDTERVVFPVSELAGTAAVFAGFDVEEVTDETA